MIKAFVFLFIIFFSFFSYSLEKEKHEYYYGKAQTRFLQTENTSTEVQNLLLKKISLPEENEIIEVATTLDKTGKMKDFSVFINIQGNQLSVTDEEGSVKGTGKLHGEAWHWDLIEFSLSSQGGKIRIEDKNWIFPGKLKAKKEFYFSHSSRPFMLWELSADQISEEKYQELYSEMHSVE